MWLNETDRINRRVSVRLLIVVAAFLVVGIAPLQAAARPSVQNTDGTAVLCSLEDSFALIADRARPGVVSITAVHTGVSGMRASAASFVPPREHGGSGELRLAQSPNPLPYAEQTVTATGSGVIVRRDGANYYILTNQHVIGNATRVKVHLHDGTELKARVVGIDPVTDLAVVTVTSPKLSDKNVVALGDSNDVKVGAWAIALGSPLGFDETMTVGVVSALQRQLEDEEVFYTDLIQTDAAINRGNSGGPLLDVEGNVIGINTAIASPTGGFVGLGFAIPINVAKSVVDTLIRDGRVIRGWLGIGIQDLTPPLQEYYGSDKGVLVVSVDPGGPAARSGLQEEDIILSIDGAPVEDIFRVQLTIAAAIPGNSMEMSIVRGHSTRPVSVVVALSPRTPPAPSPPGPETGRQNLGLRVRTLSGDQAAQVGLMGAKGVVVVDLEAGSIAEDAGLDVGDVITRMNGQPVNNDKDFAAMIERVRSAEVMTLRVIRDGSPRIVGIKRE